MSLSNLEELDTLVGRLAAAPTQDANDVRAALELIGVAMKSEEDLPRHVHRWIAERVTTEDIERTLRMLHEEAGAQEFPDATSLRRQKGLDSVVAAVQAMDSIDSCVAGICRWGLPHGVNMTKLAAWRPLAADLKRADDAMSAITEDDEDVEDWLHEMVHVIAKALPSSFWPSPPEAVQRMYQKTGAFGPWIELRLLANAIEALVPARKPAARHASKPMQSLVLHAGSSGPEEVSSAWPIRLPEPGQYAEFAKPDGLPRRQGSFIKFRLHIEGGLRLTEELYTLVDAKGVELFDFSPGPGGICTVNPDDERDPSRYESWTMDRLPVSIVRSRRYLS